MTEVETGSTCIFPSCGCTSGSIVPRGSTSKAAVHVLIWKGGIGSVFAVQRGLPAAHPDVAVHEARIGQFRTFPAPPCGTLPHIPGLALRGNRRERPQIQRLAAKYVTEYVDFRVRGRRKHAVF